MVSVCPRSRGCRRLRHSSSRCAFNASQLLTREITATAIALFASKSEFFSSSLFGRDKLYE